MRDREGLLGKRLQNLSVNRGSVRKENAKEREPGVFREQCFKELKMVFFLE
jgi:hypothetical protein